MNVSEALSEWKRARPASRCLKEDKECYALWQIVKVYETAYPLLQGLFHIPNEGKRTQHYANRMALLGLRKGVLDYCLPVPMHGFHSLWIEMKAEKGRLTKTQAAYKAFLEENGNKVIVPNNWVNAWNAIVDYLELPERIKI